MPPGLPGESPSIDDQLAARLDNRPPPPGKTHKASAAPAAGTVSPSAPVAESAPAPSSGPEARPPAKVRGLLEEEDEEEEPVGEIKGPEEPAPKIAPVVVNKEEPLPVPPPPPAQSPAPPPKTAAAAGLTDAERMRLLEDRFLRGEITELTYRELRDKLGKK
jgi:hypothetical protein